MDTTPHMLLLGAANTYDHDIHIDEVLSSKLKKLTQKKKALLYRFIDRLNEQQI